MPHLYHLVRHDVRLSVAGADESALAIFPRGSPPAARLRLYDGEGFLRPVVHTPHDRGADAEEVTRREPIGDARGQRLPHQVGDKGHRLPVGGGGSGRDGVEDRAGCRQDLERAEAAVAGGAVGVCHGLQDCPRGGDGGAPGRVYRALRLLPRPSQVYDKLVVGDLHCRLHRDRGIRYPVVVDGIARLEGPVRELLQLQPGQLLPLRHYSGDRIEDKPDPKLVAELLDPPGGHPQSGGVSLHIPEGHHGCPHVCPDHLHHRPNNLPGLEELNRREDHPLLVYLGRVGGPAPKVHPAQLAPVALDRRESHEPFRYEDRHHQGDVVEVRPARIGNVSDADIARDKAVLSELPDAVLRGEVERPQEPRDAVCLCHESAASVRETGRVVEYLVDDRALARPPESNERLLRSRDEAALDYVQSELVYPGH